MITKYDQQFEDACEQLEDLMAERTKLQWRIVQVERLREQYKALMLAETQRMLAEAKEVEA